MTFLQINEKWALSADKLQWILQRHWGGRWRDVSYVSSTKDRHPMPNAPSIAYRAPLLNGAAEPQKPWQQTIFPFPWGGGCAQP